jgi:hypothetical protein
MERRKAVRARWSYLLLVPAVGIGIAIGVVDSSPHWDDAGITVGALLIASGLLGALAPRRAWLWALAAGVWIPLFNILLHHSYASVVAIAFAFGGAYAGALAGWLLRHAAAPA